LATVIQHGLACVYGVAPSDSLAWKQWMIFDKNYLHVISADDLNKLPRGWEIVLVEKSVALLPLDTSKPSENQPPSTVE